MNPEARSRSESPGVLVHTSVFALLRRQFLGCLLIGKLHTMGWSFANALWSFLIGVGVRQHIRIGLHKSFVD